VDGNATAKPTAKPVESPPESIGGIVDTRRRERNDGRQRASPRPRARSVRTHTVGTLANGAQSLSAADARPPSPSSEAMCRP
jgi:hypothetical protein